MSYDTFHDGACFRDKRRRLVCVCRPWVVDLEKQRPPTRAEYANRLRRITGLPELKVAE